MDRCSATVRRTSAVVVLFLLSTSNHHTLAAQPADFGFRFEVRDCLAERLDTFSGIFTKDLGGSPGRTVKAQIALTDAQMSTIYRTIESIKFFDYPATFVGVATGVPEVTTTVPYDTYHLEVRNGGVIHAVTWKDAYKPTTVEADRLRNLFRWCSASSTNTQTSNVFRCRLLAANRKGSRCAVCAICLVAAAVRSAWPSLVGFIIVV